MKYFPQAGSVIIFLGINDLQDGDAEKAKQTVANVKAMIESARAEVSTLRILICSPLGIAVEKRTKGVIDAKYNEKTHAACALVAEGYRDLAEKTGCTYVHLLGLVPPEHMGDGLHPSEQGHALIAAAIAKALTAPATTATGSSTKSSVR